MGLSVSTSVFLYLGFGSFPFVSLLYSIPLCLFYHITLYHIILYCIIYYYHLDACFFLMKVRKGVNPDGKGSGVRRNLEE